MKFYGMSAEEAYEKFLKEYNDVCRLGLEINMARGKPVSKQLSLSEGMLNCLTDDDLKNASVDCRNYGTLDGIDEAKKLFADIMEVSPDNIFVCGNSSLNIMYDVIAKALLLGVLDGFEPWSKQGKIKFLCPCPGYDRHFAICERFGIEMINIEMTESGPDMDKIEELVSSDPLIKGIWCVPKYSNPQGITYSDETVRRFAALKPAAKDFRVFWDNAYCIHDFYENGDKLLNLLELCKGSENEDMVYVFFSTSKISYAGSGVAAVASSDKNIAWLKKQMTIQTIGFDKVNQLRHVKFFKNKAGVLNHMKKHAEIMRPKFEAVLNAFDSQLKPLGIAEYTRPHGGYFISLDVPKGCAKRTIELCKNAGVILTDAGATYPYHNDPDDKNIRIAPSFISTEKVENACKVLCSAVKLAALEKILNK